MCSRYAFVPEPAAWADFHAVLAEVADELLALPPRPKLVRVAAPPAKIPHQLRPQGGRGFMFAGLWSLWEKKGSGPFSPTAGWRAPDGSENGPDPFFSMVTCVILTTASSEAIAAVHDRMPVVLAPAAWRAWLDPQTGSAGAQALLREHAVRALFAVAVS